MPVVHSSSRRLGTRRSLPVDTLALLFLSLTGASSAGAQAGAGQQAPPVVADSTPIDNARSAAGVSRRISAEGSAARAAQDAFERNRRAGLRFYNGGGAASCEVQIGTLCYWNNNGDVPPPAERTDLVIERERLLEVLEVAAKADPGDDWVHGMRVRYALEQQKAHIAVQAARECGGTPWWCDALRGLALHVSNEHVNAASAFERSLASMPDSMRCAWTDLRPWLPTSMHEAYGASSCAGRTAANERILRLAQPLWMLPANDLRNELYARHIISIVHSQGRIPYDMPFGEAIPAMQVRYGWPTAWSMQTAGALDPRLPSIIGHEPTPSYDFMPTPEAMRTPLSASATDWEPDREDARMRYAPRYATGFSALPHQFARFRRGDSTVVASAWRLTRTQRMGAGPYRVGLFAADDSVRIVSETVRDSAAANGAVVTALGTVPRLLSLEVMGASARRTARVRAAVAPLADSVRVSDMLLLAGGDAGAAPTLESVAPRAWGSNDIEPGRAFGLYWETYVPVTPNDPLQVTVRATRTSSSFVQRITNALRLSRAMTPVAVSFRDAGRPDGAPGRAIQFNWPEVPPGEYRLTVLLRRDGLVDSTSALFTVRGER
ncbi:MAG TPA: hypothetical protein PKE51_00970 [Gemmatimonadaceae bacterium]|nr:hypothetical protein [Gemmatimonadaceae bacterium]